MTPITAEHRDYAILEERRCIIDSRIEPNRLAELAQEGWALVDCWRLDDSIIFKDQMNLIFRRTRKVRYDCLPATTDDAE